MRNLRTAIPAAAMLLVISWQGVAALAQDLPAEPTVAATPTPTESEAPPLLEPCPLQDGETAITKAAPITATPAAPALQATSTTTWVVDLAGEPEGTFARLGTLISWQLRVEDFNLSVTGPTGEVTSNGAQPDAEPQEYVETPFVSHCSRVTVSIVNALAPAGQGLTLTGTLNPDPYTAPPALSSSLPDTGPVPGSTWVYVAAPGASTGTGFVPSVGFITRGGTATLAGADTTTHNIACVDKDPVTRKALCKSEFVGPGATADIVGVSSLPPGEYPLVCLLHPTMTASLTVLPVPPA